MKKLLIVLMIVAMASFLFVGCLPTITPSNEAPIITSDPITTATVGVLYTYDVEATDPDGDKLTYSLTVMPSGMIITSATGLIAWTPPAEGDYDVTVKVSDGTLYITQPFVIAVSEPGLYLAGIVVDPEDMDLVVGGTEDIVSVTATYVVRAYGVDIDLEDCLFLTSDEDVATVKTEDKVVTVTAEGVGTTDILVEYEGKFATLKVTVIAKALDHITVLPDEMTFSWIEEVNFEENIDSVIAYYNDKTTAVIDLTVDEDGEYKCTYESDYEDIATVSKVGMVEAVSVGKTDIIVSYKEGNITATDTVEVTVLDVRSDDATLKSLTLTVGTEGEDLIEDFLPTETKYTVGLATLPDPPDILVTPTATESGLATITVKTNGTEWGDVAGVYTITPIELGDITTITIVVTAENDATKEYIVTVTAPPEA